MYFEIQLIFNDPHYSPHIPPPINCTSLCFLEKKGKRWLEMQSLFRNDFQASKCLLLLLTENHLKEWKYWAFQRNSTPFRCCVEGKVRYDGSLDQDKSNGSGGDVEYIMKVKATGLAGEDYTGSEKKEKAEKPQVQAAELEVLFWVPSVLSAE